MGAFLTHALNEHKILVKIDEVEKGNKCNCTCPHCGKPVQARHGNIREHYFAHQKGQTCEGAYESALHYLAKQTIQEVGGIMLPESNNPNKPSGFVRLHDICVEKWDDEYKFKPDIEGIMDDGRRLLIECFVTSKVKDKKRRIIIDNNLLCIEINVNWFNLDKDDMHHFISKESDNREWIVEKIKPDAEESGISYYSQPYDHHKESLELRELFESNKLSISLCYILHKEGNPNIHNLRNLGYDTCVVGANFRGFKSDVLLYRSCKNDKGYISINFRTRRRNQSAKLPANIRIIDIITDGHSCDVKKRFKDGIFNRFQYGLEFSGCWKM